MGILSGQPVQVSPADPTDDAEIAALRDVMRSDEPYPDEPPVLDDFDDPTEADSLWWALETEPDDSYDRWLDSLAPAPDAHCNDCGGFFGYQREEP